MIDSIEFVINRFTQDFLFQIGDKFTKCSLFISQHFGCLRSLHSKFEASINLQKILIQTLIDQRLSFRSLLWHNLASANRSPSHSAAILFGLYTFCKWLAFENLFKLLRHRGCSNRCNELGPKDFSLLL